MGCGRVNHSWCMGVVSRGYGGLGGGRDGDVGWYARGLVAYREM